MTYRIAPSSPPAKPTTCGAYSPQERSLRDTSMDGKVVITMQCYEELLRRERLLLDLIDNGELLNAIAFTSRIAAL